MAQLLGWKLSLHGVPATGTVVTRSGGGSLNRYPSGTPVTRQPHLRPSRRRRDRRARATRSTRQLPELRTRATALAGPVAAPQGQVTLAVQAAAVRTAARRRSRAS